MPAFCLDGHARYRCHHSGACCESWSVPVEPVVVEIVRARAVRRHDVKGPLFVTSATPSGEPSWNIARDTRGECVFFDRDAGRLCMIHRDIGEHALPAACRHFPRKVLHDSRGTLISLSHFCPTAAAMLIGDYGLSIVDARPPVFLGVDMEGLDARDALPPLLRPGLLCDMDGYDAWERSGIALLARREAGYRECLDDLAAATELIREWRPGGRSFLDAVHSAVVSSSRPRGPISSHTRMVSRVATLTAGSAADALVPVENFENEWVRRCGEGERAWFDRAMKNYLAARLFANWIAYQGQGLRSVVEWLRTCAAVVRHFTLERVIATGGAFDPSVLIESVRSADLLLLHVLDGVSFAKDVAGIEESSPV